jgi:hypothetical protein
MHTMMAKSNSTLHSKTAMMSQSIMLIYNKSPLSDEFDRALQTKDIDGAVPGTLISKVVKNKEIAQKMKKQ